MYNTTTIPTVIETQNLFYSFFAFMVTAFPFWAGMMHIIYKQKKEELDEDDDEEDDEREKKYMDELIVLPDRELSENVLSELAGKQVRETVEGIEQSFDIILTYNKETESFWYFTDNLKEVSYDTLETVARKFVIEYDCKRLYVTPIQTAEQKEQGQASAEQGQKQTVQVSAEQEEQASAAQKEQPSSVFAKFKKYNTTVKNNNSQPEEPANRFRYKGKLYQYEESLKNENAVNQTLDYATYKLLMQTIKEN